MAGASLSVVIVAHQSAGDLRRTLPPLVAQLDSSDELIIVDSGSRDALAAVVAEAAPAARLIDARGNVGFAAAANLGAGAASGDVIVLLNPDATVTAGWADAIRAPWMGPWAAWMALVALRDGHAINTSGGVLHFTGLGWAGQVGQPLSQAPHEPREVGFLSGACLAVPGAAWRALGGFPEPFFMYCEDVDMSLRLRLSGGRLGVIPGARVDHDYDFAKGQLKWRLLERNRWATMLRTYPAALLLAVAPALAVTELAIWLAAARGRWLGMKALATVDVVRWLPRLLRERRVIQSGSSTSPREFADHLTAGLDSPYLGAIGRHPLVRGALAAYWRAVLSLLPA